MKNWIKAALFGLSIPMIFIAIVAIWAYEGMPGFLQVALVAFYILLFVYLIKMCWDMRKDRKKRERDILEQRRQQTVESAQYLDEPTADSILYLRPFKVDEEYMSEVEYAGKLYSSFESVICRMITDSGTPVAIGRPGEELQPLGARRIYATDETWQEKVKAYFQKSKYVILYVDFTPGVRWEIENALADYKDKLILIPSIYNRREVKKGAILLTEITFLFYFFYSLWFNHFLFSKAHRGRAYYRQWKQLMGRHLRGIKMNDKVSAIIFENGKAVPFLAKKPNQEEQFAAIHRAICAKLGQDKEQVLLIRKKEKPLQKLICDLGVQNTYNTALYPFSQGILEFYENGLRCKYWFSWMKINIRIREEFRSIARYGGKQLIPYTSIRDVVTVKNNCLCLHMEQTNGSMNLVVPVYHSECIPGLKRQLEACCREGKFIPDGSGELERFYGQQKKDYGKAFLLMEAISWILGLGLFIAALCDIDWAGYILLVLGGIWNLAMVFCAYIYLRNSNARLWFAGIPAIVLHLLLASAFGL